MSSTLTFANTTFGIASFSNISVTETDVGTVGSFTASPMAFAAQNVPIVGVSAYQGLEWQGFQAGAYAPGSSTTLNFSFDVASTDPTQGLGQMFAAFQPDAQAGSGISINVVEKVYDTSGNLVGEENLNLGDTTGTPGSQPGDLPMFAAYQNLHVDVTVTASVAANAPAGSLDDFSIIDFGFKPTPLTQTASIGDNVFMDTAGTGIQTGVNAGPGVAGVTVNLLSANGSTVLATTTTDANGDYNFANLLPGTYEVQFVSPTGYAFSPENASSNPDLSSSANPTTGITAPITVTAGQHIVSVDAGLVPTGTIGNTVYLDSTDSGVPTGIGVAGVTVELLNATGTTVLATTTTNAQGQYEFTHLPPGTYEVQFVPPAGYVIAPANTSVTVLDAPNPTTGITNPLALTGGQNITNADCGLYQPASIGNTVFLDKADTGALTTTGVAGVTVKLLNAAGTTVLATTTTDANGHYTFANLAPGTYEVQFVEPSGYTFSPEGGSSASLANPTTGLTTQITLTSGENLTTVDAGLVPPAPPPPVAPQLVVDKMPGSLVINANGTETYTIDVTNTGTTAITKLSLVDNIGTASKPIDVTPTAVLKNGYNVGDTNHDGILSAGETWQYTVTTTVSGSGVVTVPSSGSSGSGSNCGGGSWGGSGSNCYGGSSGNSWGGSDSNQGGWGSSGGSNCYSGGSWGGSGSNCYGGSSGNSWGGSDSNQGGWGASGGSNCYSGGSSYGSGSNCYSGGSWGGSGSNCYGGSSGSSWGGSDSNQGGWGSSGGSNCYSGGSSYGSGSNCYGGSSGNSWGGSDSNQGGWGSSGGSNCYS
ncbi:MAG: carboxypeptidase regulatory-like domain-containing protein, partial [Rhodospirillales bacterium]|nr:carboxypeptidase regulatory-like domain-containing protein [Rhodospirillales bacterium]